MHIAQLFMFYLNFNSLMPWSLLVFPEQKPKSDALGVFEVRSISDFARNIYIYIYV